MLYEINTKYDPEGNHEVKYAQIKETLASAQTPARQLQESDDDSDNDNH
jgi:hypothetical protein